MIVSAATILLIVLLLALIFRSVIICLMPIIVVALVGTVANGLIAVANELFDLKASSDVEVILFVVLYGIGTDYILFFLFRYRERLREGEEKRDAVAHALERAGEAIASAGGAVIVAFMALVLSSLGIFRAIGPALAIAVAVTLVAALTLVPASSTVLGTGVVLAVEEVPRRARGRPLRGRRPAPGRPPRPVRPGLRRHPRRAVAHRLHLQPELRPRRAGTSDTAESTIALENQTRCPAGASGPDPVLLPPTGGDPYRRGRRWRPSGRHIAEVDGVATAQPSQVLGGRHTWSITSPAGGQPVVRRAIATVKGRSATGADGRRRPAPRRSSAARRRSSWTSRRP